MTSSAFGFKAVPNGILIDPEGIIRYTKYGGFSVDKHEDVATVERFLKGEAISSGPQPADAYVLSPAERELVETKLKLGGSPLLCWKACGGIGGVASGSPLRP